MHHLWVFEINANKPSANVKLLRYTKISSNERHLSSACHLFVTKKLLGSPAQYLR